MLEQASFAPKPKHSLRFEGLIALVRGRYENNGDPGHDFLHISRVINTCRQIGAEVGADLEILLPAALLHDIINVSKNHPDRIRASQQAADEAKAILQSTGYESEEIDRIQVVIVEHSYSLGLRPSCIESAVMQDADRLDAIGAIGVMRNVSCGTKMGSRFYSQDEPIAKTRALDDKQFSIDHFFIKLLKLGEKFNTEPARREGAKRIEFMHAFLHQLETEI